MPEVRELSIESPGLSGCNSRTFRLQFTALNSPSYKALFNQNQAR